MLGEGEDKYTQTQVAELLGGLSEELQLNLTEGELKSIIERDWHEVNKAEIDYSSLKLQIEKRPQILEWLYYELE